tara:strand:+ start:297 stop:1397 length:1101 start_codon:yes stop_codon:yes gene_type:complete
MTHQTLTIIGGAINDPDNRMQLPLDYNQLNFHHYNIVDPNFTDHDREYIIKLIEYIASKLCNDDMATIQDIKDGFTQQLDEFMSNPQCKILVIENFIFYKMAMNEFVELVGHVDNSIIIDFTGCYTPLEMCKNHNIQSDNCTLLPLGCLCESVPYTEFLDPLNQIEPYSNMIQFDIFTICEIIFANIDEIMGLSFDVLQENPNILENETFRVIMSSWLDDRHPITSPFDEIIRKKIHYKKYIYEYYESQEQTENILAAFNIHKRYIAKIEEQLRIQIRDLISIIHGLVKYNEVKDWYTSKLPLLGQIDNTHIPIYVYGMIHAGDKLQMFGTRDFHTIWNEIILKTTYMSYIDEHCLYLKDEITSEL